MSAIKLSWRTNDSLLLRMINMRFVYTAIVNHKSLPVFIRKSKQNADNATDCITLPWGAFVALCPVK